MAYTASEGTGQTPPLQETLHGLTAKAVNEGIFIKGVAQKKAK